MKTPPMAIFLSVVLAIYLVVNTFIYSQTRPIFSTLGIGAWLKALFWLLVLSYPAGRIAEALAGGAVPSLLVKIGSIWLGAMLYLLMAFLLLLAARLINNLWSFTDYLNFKHHEGYRQVAVMGVYGVVALVMLVGHINAITPRVSRVAISTDKSLGAPALRIVAVSDIHLGTIIGNRQLGKLVSLVNGQKPDIVLLAGDIFDEDIAPVVNGSMGVLLEQLKSKYGTYAVTGNHEYIGHSEEKIGYLTRHGVNVLRDSVALVGNFYVIGRDDRQSSQALARPRKSIGELVGNLDKSKLMILLDHQPYHLSEAEENGIDLQLSGHTHHGQLWPLSYATRGIFELSRGYLAKGRTHYYVSTGFGTWGPRVRVGNRPEIVVIDVKPVGGGE